MSGSLAIRNRQRRVRIETRVLRRLVEYLLAEMLAVEDFELGICIVGAREMTRVNAEHLGHAGSTDVITFDYGEASGLAGDIFVCADEAVIQARQFRTTWQSELARYVIHGVLHLKGFDDTTVAKRRRMKREENRLLREITRRFTLRKLERRH